ncbi:hypothetical protein H3C61_00290 [Candidatus Gracilibacteria bacterium]|nr:hypothetical protein [Candidatus Gracilibacteria bacterium]
MKKIVYIIFSISFIFILNIFFFYYSNSYSIFLKNLKNHTENKKDLSNLITDDYMLNNLNQESVPCIDTNKEVEKNPTNVDNEIIDILNENNKVIETTIPPKVDKNKLLLEKLKSGETDKNNLKLLSNFKEFNLKLNDYNEYYELFGLTTEYPNPYLTYINNTSDFDLYIFIDDTFDNIYNTFNYLSGSEEKKFSLNKTNNFGDKSFFINLENDNFIRIIIEKNNLLFGLKLKKEYYNNIKNILNNLILN